MTLNKSNFWTWFDAKRTEAMATDDGKAFAESGMEITHTGGGFVAWDFSHGDSYVWVTDDDGTGLFTKPETEYWIVGRYYDGECLEWVEVKTVAEAIEQARAYKAVMEKTTLTLDEFIKSRVVATVAQDQDFEECYGGSLFGFRYAGFCLLNADCNGQFSVLISNEERTSYDLREMETFLYENWYLPETESRKA